MAAISSDSSKTMTTPLSSVSPEKTSLKISDVVNIFVKMRRAKPAPPELESASGEPQSHPGLSETTTSDSRLPLERTDIFLCNDAVNAPTLLRATRLALLTTAEHMGADILLDEQWQISIRSLKHSRTKQYRVQVHYSALGAHSTQHDPRKPVAVKLAKSIPGLMTVIPSD